VKEAGPLQLSSFELRQQTMRRNRRQLHRSTQWHPANTCTV